MARKKAFASRKRHSIPTTRRSRSASSGLKFCDCFFYAPIVIEFGSRYTKYGLGGEIVPRNIISSFTTNPITGETVHALDRSMSHEERFLTLNAFLKKIIVKELNYIPGERRIVIVENLFVPTETRKLLARIFFEVKSFQMPAIVFVPAPLMNTFAFGTRDALVIDIGYRTTSVFPVYNSMVSFSAYEENGVGGGTMTARINDYILKKGQIRDHDGTLRALNEEEKMEFEKRKFAEEIVSSLFMVTKMDRAKLLQDFDETSASLQSPPDSKIPFSSSGRNIIIPGHLREFAAECFFEIEQIEGNIPIPELALNSLINVPIDTRRSLLNNIIITGSAACLPGMLGRFKEEMKELLEERFEKLVKEVKNLRLEGKNNNGIERYSSWLGGSLFSLYMEELNHLYYSKQNWKEKKLLPDWTNMIDDFKIQPVPDMIVRELQRERAAVIPKLSV